MNQEPGGAGDDGCLPEFAPEQTRDTQDGIGDQEVAQNTLPADGNSALKQGLQDTVGKAHNEARAESPADAVDNDGEHGQVDGSAPGHFVQGQEAEDFRQGNEDGALTQRTQTDMGCLIGSHFFGLLNKKVSH